MAVVVAVSGSRSVSVLPLPVRRLLADCHKAGCEFVVGDARGVDAAATSLFRGMYASFRVFCVDGRAPAGVRPSRCVFWAGGGRSVPIRARLLRRSYAMVDAMPLDSQLLAVPRDAYGSGSWGTWRTIEYAYAQSIDVAVFPAGVASFEFFPRFLNGVRVDWFRSASGAWSPVEPLLEDS
jgi:hypothetical protein